MQVVFGDDYVGQIVIIWIDDILIWANSSEELIQRLQMVIQRASEYGLKLSIKKAQFYTTEALWCGKIFTSKGVEHHSARIQGLISMPVLNTAAELMQFLAAANWMRDSIPEFAATMGPLQALLTQAMAGLKRRTKKAAAKVTLAKLWNEELSKTWTLAKDVLENRVALGHIDPNMALCAFPDASERYWGLFVSQLPYQELHQATQSTQHHPLIFLSGMFTKNQTNWPIVEKEGYAVVQLDRVRYLLQGRSIHIYTDHRNLQYIWGGHPSTVSKAASQRLQNWKGILSTFEYTIEHIPGESNHWGDMLSRWLGEDVSKKVIAVKLITIQRGKRYDSTKITFPDLIRLRKEQLDALDEAINNGQDP